MGFQKNFPRVAFLSCIVPYWGDFSCRSAFLFLHRVFRLFPAISPREFRRSTHYFACGSSFSLSFSASAPLLLSDGHLLPLRLHVALVVFLLPSLVASCCLLSFYVTTLFPPFNRDAAICVCTFSRRRGQYTTLLPGCWAVLPFLPHLMW